jgi:ribonuclease BN (tRNA processing enzyme)
MDAVEDVRTSFEDLAAFCAEATVLVHDATYTDSQMPEKVGLGHSTVERVCELAARAGVQDLVLFHHDPERTDDMLDELERMANDRLDALGAATSCRAAFEDLELDV